MPFHPVQILFLVTFTFILDSVVSVTLRQYNRHACGGRIAQCSDIPPNVCCQSKWRIFRSGDCQGCTSSDFQTAWTRVSTNMCGSVAGVRNGDVCLSGSSNLRGHTWCRQCRTKHKRHGLNVKEQQPCTETVEQEFLQIGRKWFRLNETVEEEQKGQIWALWSKEAGDDQVPGWILPYQTDEPEDD